MTIWSQVETPMRTTSMQMSFPETVSDSLCRNPLVMQTDCCSSCLSGWSQTIFEVNMLDVEVLGWCGYMWSAVVRPVGCTAKFSETPLETAYGREMNIQFTGKSSGGHSCCQHANCTLPQNLRPLALCCVIKLNILEWSFIVASLRHTCAIIMLSNQHLDMPHLWGGMDYLGKGEVLTITDLDRFVNNIWEKCLFCVYRKCFRSLSSSHEKWEQKQKCCIYIFVQYNYTQF